VTGRLALLAGIAGIAALDLATKAWALTLPAAGISVLPFFDLRLGFNTGVSFGMFAAEGVHGYVVLLAATLTVSIFFLWLAWGTRLVLERAGYGAIVGGAFGNLIDRLPDGAVTDFLDLHAGGWHFPTFNLADLAISAGVLLLLLGALWRRPSEP
jgi:signal peptidase II